jgi:hypothetical protein
VQKKVYVTKSQTGKIKTIKQNLEEDEIDIILSNTMLVGTKETDSGPKSALSKHYVSTGHVFTNKDFQILLSDHHRYRLLIKESLLIRQRNPKLNGTDRSLPLYIYPDGLEKNETAISKISKSTLNKNTTTGMNNSRSIIVIMNSHISDLPQNQNPPATTS